GLHAEVSHVEWVLHDNAVQLIGANRIDECLAGVEPNKRDLAGFIDILQSEQHASRGRFMGTEDSLDFVTNPVEQVFRGALRRVPGWAGVLVRGNDLDIRKLRL